MGISLTAAGCQTLPHWGHRASRPVPASHDPQTQTAVGVISFLNWFDDLPEANRGEVLARAQADFAAAPTEFNRLRLALYLCHPASAARDLDRARRLLGSTSGGDEAPPTPLRRLLLRLLDENRALHEQVAARDADIKRQRSAVKELEDKVNSLLKLEEGLQPQRPAQDLRVPALPAGDS